MYYTERMPQGILFLFHMVEITQIIHKAGCLRLDLSDGERLFIPTGKLPAQALQEGVALTDLQYRLLREESQHYLCREKALAYIAMKSCSERQLFQYLKRKKFDDQFIHETVHDMLEAGYINDYEFSLSYIRSRRQRKAVGKNMLVKELGGKGVSRKIIERAIRESGADRDDVDEVYSLALKKYDRLKEKPNALAKVGMFLRQRGFGHDTIQKVLRRLDSRSNEMWDE